MATFNFPSFLSQTASCRSRLAVNPSKQRGQKKTFCFQAVYILVFCTEKSKTLSLSKQLIFWIPSCKYFGFPAVNPSKQSKEKQKIFWFSSSQCFLHICTLSCHRKLMQTKPRKRATDISLKIFHSF